MVKKTEPIEELTRMLSEEKKNTQKKKLLEGYLSEDDLDPSMRQGPMPQADEEDFPLEGMQGGEGDAMAQQKGILPIKNEIDQIRQIALKTIAKLAENPTSDCYKFLKKVWMDCDRALESALQPDEKKV